MAHFLLNCCSLSDHYDLPWESGERTWEGDDDDGQWGKNEEEGPLDMHVGRGHDTSERGPHVHIISMFLLFLSHSSCSTTSNETRRIIPRPKPSLLDLCLP